MTTFLIASGTMIFLALVVGIPLALKESAERKMRAAIDSSSAGSGELMQPGGRGGVAEPAGVQFAPRDPCRDCDREDEG